MDPYKGEIALNSDGRQSTGTITEIVKFLKESVNLQQIPAGPQRQALRRSIDIALGKLMVPQNPRIVLDNYAIEVLIGYGSYGRIWKAYAKDSGPVAIKQLPTELEELPRLWKERDLMIYLKHPRVCKLVAAFVENDVFLVLELCYGSVAMYRNKITKQNSVRFAYQLLDGLKWIHSKDIIHADLKPDNCLINSQNNLVISDFGSAFILKKGESDIKFDEQCGSPGYLDYAANKHCILSKATDVFAAACIFFEMDYKRTLLLYPDRSIQVRSIYVDAFENGRVVNLKPGETPNMTMTREQLSQRSLQSKFGLLINKMITNEEDRLTAAEAMVDPTLTAIFSEYNVSMDLIDSGSTFVTREYNEDLSFEFKFFNASSPPLSKIALLGFSYDELEASDSTDSEAASPSLTYNSSGSKTNKRKLSDFSDSDEDDRASNDSN